MNATLYEEARNFAGADWENLKPESRRMLLIADKQRTEHMGRRWHQLPPTVQKTLAMSLIKKKKAA